MSIEMSKAKIYKWMTNYIKELEEQNKVKDELIELLEDELDDLSGYLHIHGVEFKRTLEAKKLKDKILG